MIRTSIFINNKQISDNDFTSISLEQNVGAHHLFEIRLVGDNSKGDLLNKTKAWIGTPVRIGIGAEADSQITSSPVPDIFKGYVTGIELICQSGISELVVKGESPTIFVDDGTNTRSFTNMSTQEILDKVLKPYVDKFPNGTNIQPQVYQEILPYTVQYNESNFRFINRIANRFGEWLFYDGLNFFFGYHATGETITLDFGSNTLNHFDISVQSVPVLSEIRSYAYEKHKTYAEPNPEDLQTSTLGKEIFQKSTKEIYTETPSVSLIDNMEQGDLKEYANRKEKIAYDEMVLVSGSSRNPNLKLGAKIKIVNNLIGEEYGEYVVTNLDHSIGQTGDYYNGFQAIPVEMMSPPLTAVPSSPPCDSQLAIITEVADEDSLGRVKVKFLWQEGSDETSPWIRVATPYSGKDKGFYVIPEVEDQVLVAFENNNPDKPYVLSGMYNADAKPEWFHKDNIYKGFKSKGQNQLKFDDKKESILLDAPQEVTISAGKTINIQTDGGEESSLNIDVGNGTINVIAKVIIVEAGQTIDVKSNKEIMVESTKTIDVETTELTSKGNQKVEISGTQIEILGTTIKVEGSAKSEVKGAVVDVSGTGPVNVKGLPIKLN